MDLIDVLTAIGAFLVVLAALCHPLGKDDADGSSGKSPRDNARQRRGK